MEDDFDDNRNAKPARTPHLKATEKLEELRMHAELAAVFEGTRKFDAEIRDDLKPSVADDLRKTLMKLERNRLGQVIPPPDYPSGKEFPEGIDHAARILALSPSRNDYHVLRGDGQVQLARWLEGDQVDSFYSRLSAHFDAALGGVVEDLENEAWRQDDATTTYIDALKSLKLDLEEKYIRGPVREMGLFALSTHTVDELNISYLADSIMSITTAELVGAENAPPADGEPTEADLTWYLKLFLLRGVKGTGKGEQAGKVEQAMFFAFLQKSQ
jgi:hypothetical protein